MERVERTGTSEATSSLLVEKAALDPSGTPERGELERRDGTVTAAGLSSFNRQGDEPRLALRAELESLRERFELSRRGEGSSSATLSGYRDRLRLLFRFLAERNVELRIEGLADVTPEHLSLYRDHLLTREKLSGSGFLSANAVAHHVSAIKAFCRFLFESGLLLVDPARDLVRPRRPRRLPRDVPSPAQVRRLLFVSESGTGLLASRDTAILELFYSSGLRNSELCELHLADYDAARSLLLVRRGKGGKDRVVPVGRKANEAVEAYLGLRPRVEDPHLFLTRKSRRLSPVLVRHIVRRAARRAGLKRLVPHALRHACATHLLKGRADIRHIQALLGHASLSTTEIYTRLDVSDLKKVLARCHPRERRDEA